MMESCSAKANVIEPSCGRCIIEQFSDRRCFESSCYDFLPRVRA